MDSLAVRATINVQLEAMLGEVTMRVYRERKWFLPLEENEVEAEIESKIVSQELEEQHQETQVIGLEHSNLEVGMEQEDWSDLRLREAMGEVTPSSTPKSNRRRKSPRSKAKHFSRLFHFQHWLSEEHGLPPSRLQERRSKRRRRHFLLPPHLVWDKLSGMRRRMRAGGEGT